eukprot:4906447-Karenia_brevis.AAC.1
MASHAQAASSHITATAVRSFFGALPATVAGHPEGQEAIKTVMQMLEKLDQAAKVEHTAHLPAAGASATALAHVDGDASAHDRVPAEAQMEMDLDD